MCTNEHQATSKKFNIDFKKFEALATTNHGDFPTFLFDRIGVFTVATEKDVIPIGIYAHNATKARALGLA